MKKILIVITKGAIGGAQKVALDLAKESKRQGNQVTVGIGEGRYLRDKLGEIGIPVIDLRWLKRTADPVSNIFFVFEMKKLLDREAFDIVHFHSSNALAGSIGAKLSKTKPRTLFTFHGLSMLDPNYETNLFARTIYRLYFKFFLRFIDEKIFVCDYNLDVARKIKLVDEGLVARNTLDPAEADFRPREEARVIIGQKCGFDPEGKSIIGSIGRLAYPKNYEFLISAFPAILENIPQAVGVIIGEGPERQKYERLIIKNRLEGKFFLFGEKAEAGRLIKGFDLFVLPSKYEGLSMTLLEAKQAGVRILASDVGGSKEILSPGQLYELDNREEFLKKALNKPDGNDQK